MPKRKKRSGFVQLATFFLGDELFGVDTLHVQEILTYQEITPVPLAPEYVRGLINLRGQIVTVIDLRRRLGFDKFDDERSSMNLIVNSDEGLMSLLVDNIGNVLDIAADRLQPPPGTIRGVAVHYIQDVCQLEGELLIVLDLESILQPTIS
ncbi:chemotaxis protein CheW [candidate division KSB3 bacterium]|uniref:Chemotaxis protein CheW n=1 Tax=candidate division KSB3 bacterium TaxID=2044937 RepID=A0A9D5Q5A6_9BACT|nr:chemotaxis protein CheW [candidate division KSB3 bacterium]MBD3323716.1 chemotaxis protein CheW [candidate division KSB3 bacterium]